NFLGITFSDVKTIFTGIGISIFITAVYFYFFHLFRHIKDLWNDKLLFYFFGISGFLIFLVFSLFFYPIITHIFPSLEVLANIKALALLSLIILILGFFANPNIISLHRFYRMRLKDTFLEGNDFYLHEFLDKKIPYPLINTTLNISGDKRLAGKKSFDFFLLSPLFCGSKLTKYVQTKESYYGKMHVSTAITISGAAINPMMGIYTNRILSFLITLLNVRLGYWADNPLFYKKNNFLARLARLLSNDDIVFWPYYNLMSMFGKATLDRLKINLSDGGHIENLGAFELLRRECGLVLVVDAGVDKDYQFEDFKNFVLRATNELGVEISFDEDEKLEKVIKPSPSEAFSKRNFAVGKIKYKNGKEGILVYVKTSLTRDAFSEEEKIKGKSKKPTYLDYKRYHPDFPHESTLDQSFDPLQWEAYEMLGEDIAKRFLHEIENNPKYEKIKNLLFK
ncbi:MAG: hypothetical protein GXO21_02030, partial [Aquificae bacterium]|nr:hypothetical protein [Aquificota bacterium]